MSTSKARYAIGKVLERPLTCPQCAGPNPELMNISGEQRLDPSDWTWLCRRCRMRADGRIVNNLSIGMAPKSPETRAALIAMLGSPEIQRKAARARALKWARACNRGHRRTAVNTQTVRTTGYRHCMVCKAIKAGRPLDKFDLRQAE